MIRRLLILTYLLSFILFPLFVMELANQRLASIPLRLLFFCLLAAGGSWLFMQAWPQHGWNIAVIFTALGYGAAYKLASFIPEISNYPFSLSWSEASRFYYASLWFSKSIYGITTPPSVLHPSRYLLQSLPFLIHGAPIWVHRLWQVILWVITASLTSWVLIRRLASGAQKRTAVVSLSLVFSAFLFLFQGPVYYHLLVMVILILWGFSSKTFWKNLLLVIIASLWAGISRVNWLPVPGLLAASLYLLEIKIGDKPLYRYLLPPVIYVVVGTAIAYGSQQAYQLWSGNPAAWFGSSFSSDLLWYRLFPNQTYPLGILPSAFLVSLPLVGLMSLHLIQHWREVHPLRVLSLAAILFVLFAGGIVVSVKIGGGSNLHNLDAYLALLLVIGANITLGGFLLDKPGPASENDRNIIPAMSRLYKTLSVIFTAAAIAVPLYFSLSTGGQIFKWDLTSTQAALQAINSAAQQASTQGGEVLFINQRHLLTFDYIKGISLVPEDELVFLMEMAMSNNPTYLDSFHADLSHQRFNLIVSEPLTTLRQGKSHSFGEENDAWVERVSEPILCYYQPTTALDTVGVVLYTPRSDPCQ